MVVVVQEDHLPQEERAGTVSPAQVVARVGPPIQAGCPALWAYLEARLDEELEDRAPDLSVLHITTGLVEDGLALLGAIAAAAGRSKLKKRAADKAEAAPAVVRGLGSRGTALQLGAVLAWLSGKVLGQYEAFTAGGDAVVMAGRSLGFIPDIETLEPIARANPNIAVLRAAVTYLFCEVGRIDEARELFARDAADGVLRQDGVENGVRYLVTDFVGVTAGNTFCRITTRDVDHALKEVKQLTVNSSRSHF